MVAGDGGSPRGGRESHVGSRGRVAGVSGSDRARLAARLTLALGAFLFALLVAEGIATALYRRGLLDPVSIWLHVRSDPRGQLRYDPVRGSWLSSRPARMAVVTTDGEVEYRSTYRGNRQGFPDRNDFEAQRRDRGVLRLAVFGDSFSAAQYLAVNWPDRAEDLARKAGHPIELLNFSLDGGGLGNWASVLIRFIQPEGYELDGVIFAVWGEDLKRRFGWWDDASRSPGAEAEPVLFGRPLMWGLGAIPPDREAALESPYELSARRLAVSEAQLEAALDGRWRPPVPRLATPYLWHRASAGLARLRHPPGATPRRGTFHAGQLFLIRKIRRALAEMELPAQVVRIPNRREDRSWEGEAEAFARLLGATYVDGAEAFAGLGWRGRRALWSRVDGHWSQEGSDRFAAFMAERLRRER